MSADKGDPVGLRQRIATAMRTQLGREPTPKELDAALALRREALAEFAAPSAARITRAEKNASNRPVEAALPVDASHHVPRNELTGEHPERIDDCTAPAQWIEPTRPAPTTTAKKINEASRAMWADPQSHMTQVAMAATEAENQKAIAATKAAAEAELQKVVASADAEKQNALAAVVAANTARDSARAAPGAAVTKLAGQAKREKARIEALAYLEQNPGATRDMTAEGIREKLNMGFTTVRDHLTALGLFASRNDKK